MHSHVMSRNVFSGWPLNLACTMWVGLVTSALVLIAKHANSAGAIASPPVVIEKADTPTGQFQVMVFLHPLCPCSKATAVELANVLARSPGKFSLTVVLFQSGELVPATTQAEVAHILQVIPNVCTIVDVDATVAKQWHVVTSGQVLCYNPDGQLVFNGGVTQSRGHEGRNRAADELSRCLSSEAKNIQTPVFGCSLVQEKS